MIPIDRRRIEQTRTLEEAIKEVFDLEIEVRTCTLTEDSMCGDVAIQYDTLGKNVRKTTYGLIAQDYVNSVKDWLDPFAERIRTGKILEIGCGSGLLSIELAKILPDTTIHGVDLSQEMVNIGNKNPEKTENITFHQASVYDIEGTYDGVVCRNALHRFRDSPAALERMISVLRPHCKLYIRDIRRDADWKTIIARIGEQRWNNPELVQDYIGAMAAMLTIEELEDVLGEVGLKRYQYLIR